MNFKLENIFIILIPIIIFFSSKSGGQIQNSLPVISIMITFYLSKNIHNPLNTFGIIFSIIITSYFFPYFAVFNFFIYFLLLIMKEK